MDQVEDPVSAVASVLERVPDRLLMSLYSIGAYSSCEDMLRQVAAARGRLRKGGTADLQAAARIVLLDWRDGRIPFHTLPPSRGNEHLESAAVVATFSKAFDLPALIENEEKNVLMKLQELPSPMDA
jgi:nuclear GTP-binding protein